ncbi:MAG: hypothetical protein WC563_13520 [Brevundimonas sp.]
MNAVFDGLERALHFGQSKRARPSEDVSNVLEALQDLFVQVIFSSTIGVQAQANVETTPVEITDIDPRA